MIKKWRNIRSYKINVSFKYKRVEVFDEYIVVFKKNFKETLKIYFNKDADLELSNNPLELKEQVTELRLIPKIADYYELLVDNIESEDIKDINTLLFNIGDLVKTINPDYKISILSFKASW